MFHLSDFWWIKQGDISVQNVLKKVNPFNILKKFLSSSLVIDSSSIGSEFAPHVRHIILWRLGHENISTAILPLPLIQEEQLSVTGERMCIKYW